MAGKDDITRFPIQIGNLGYRVVVRPDSHRGGYEALLLTDYGDTLLMPNGVSPNSATKRLVNDLLSTDDALERKIANAIVQKTGVAVHATKSRSHATKRAIPGVSKWDMFAGGTGAAEGKRGYTYTTPEGTYHIWPYTTKHGRHAGYLLKFAISGKGGSPRGGHTGLWHELGSHASPAKAASEAAKHYARGFE